MNTSTRFAVFIDLENAGAKESMLNNIIEKVKIRGDILLGKVYGYTDRYSELKEALLSNTFYVVPSLRYGHNQKNNLDIQLVIDALEVAYKNELIDSFCIVSGDSDYTPLVGKLKSMGKHVLGISRSEVASGIFIKACNEFIFLESVAAKPQKPQEKEQTRVEADISELTRLVETVLENQEENVYASELKSTIIRLRPEFNERDYGCSTFGKLLARLASASPSIKLINESPALRVGLNRETSAETPATKLTSKTWMPFFVELLERFKAEGFERVNPSILKAAVLTEHPDFDEKQIGFKRFSDVMKRIEKEGLVDVELDEAHTMLIKIK